MAHLEIAHIAYQGNTEIFRNICQQDDLTLSPTDPMLIPPHTPVSYQDGEVEPFAGFFKDRTEIGQHSWFIYLFIYLFISSSVALVFELFSYFINFNEKNKKSCQNSFSEEFVALKKVQALPLFDQWTAAAAASLHHYSN